MSIPGIIFSWVTRVLINVAVINASRTKRVQFKIEGLFIMSTLHLIKTGITKNHHIKVEIIAGFNVIDFFVSTTHKNLSLYEYS